MAFGSKGYCYLCGAELGKAAIKNHLLKAHNEPDAEQRCYLLKVEGAHNKDYWLYLDVSVGTTLSRLDAFLRDIWLECCGHLSAFSRAGGREISESRKWSAFAIGDKLLHEYDFGSTTETLITIMGESQRKKQKGAVRLLARNVPPTFECGVCGKLAAHICVECIYESDNPFLCDECGDKHEHEEMMLPVTNSPRMGVCGYGGETDDYAFTPKKE